MDSRKLFWSILFLAAFSSAAINWYLSWKGERKVTDEHSDRVPDIILESISQLNFNDIGEKHFLLNATEALHFMKRGITEFKQPQLFFFENNVHNWDASAKSGITPDNGDNFKLSGDVVIRKLGSAAGKIELHTHSMNISPKSEIAETGDAVEIFQGTNRTLSKGLRIEMQTGKLTLQNKVVSRYNPPAS